MSRQAGNASTKQEVILMQPKGSFDGSAIDRARQRLILTATERERVQSGAFRGHWPACLLVPIPLREGGAEEETGETDGSLLCTPRREYESDRGQGRQLQRQLVVLSPDRSLMSCHVRSRRSVSDQPTYMTSAKRRLFNPFNLSSY